MSLNDPLLPGLVFASIPIADSLSVSVAALVDAGHLPEQHTRTLPTGGGQGMNNGGSTNTATPEQSVWQQLTQSDPVREQQAALTCATGLPVTLLSATAGERDAVVGGAEGPCRTTGCLGGTSGELCQDTLNGAEQRAACTLQAEHFRCFTGLTKILVPVVIRGRHVGNVLAGPFSAYALGPGTLRRLTRQLKELGLDTRVDGVLDCWRCRSMISRKQDQAATTLLTMFAQHLSERGNQLLSDKAAAASPVLQTIEAYLAENSDRKVSLAELARSVHVSPCHFCKLFKKQTGVTFTTYHVHARIEHAKQLLLNPHRRISEVAHDAGFGSISHFNRAFRRLVGCSPTQYRAARALVRTRSSD